MKSTRSKLIFASAALCLVIVSASSFKSSKTQQPGGKYLSMRTMESGGWGPLPDNKIIIAYEDGRVEEIELGKSKPSGIGENMKKITAKINVLSGQGYELISTSGTDQWTTTYTFVKK